MKDESYEFGEWLLKGYVTCIDPSDGWRPIMSPYPLYSTKDVLKKFREERRELSFAKWLLDNYITCGDRPSRKWHSVESNKTFTTEELYLVFRKYLTLPIIK